MDGMQVHIKSLAIALTIAASFALPARAEHILQSIPLNSPDSGSIQASAFVHAGGSLYLAGSVSGAVDFNPNGAPAVYTGLCPEGCPFVARYDEAMQLAWVDFFYASGDAEDQRLVARSGGGVYLLLDFTDDFAYRPNEIQPLYHASEESDVAIVALDGDGAFAGSAQLGGDGANRMRNSRPFEAAPGVVDFAWSHRGDPLADARVASIARADVSTGIVSPSLIAITATDAASFAEIRDQRPDSTGRYICGEFYGTLDFDSLHAHRIVTTSAQVIFEGFIARYDNDGALVWLSTITNTTPDFAECYGLAVAGDGTLWAAADFGGSAEINDDAGTVPIEISAGSRSDALLIAYDPEGALISHATLGGDDAGTEVYLDRIEAAADGSIAITGQFEGTIVHGFVGELLASSASDYRDGFVLFAAPDLSTRYFGHVGYEAGYTREDTLQLTGPMQYETIVQMSTPLGGNAFLDYAFAPELAWLHNDGTAASAYVRYDLDAMLVNGFDE